MEPPTAPTDEAHALQMDGAQLEHSTATMTVASEANAFPISSYETDFRIDVKHWQGQASFLVCAAIVLTMCPAILNETGRDKALESRTCEVTEHDPDTVRLVLEIAHGHYFTLPSKITFERLVALARVAEHLLLTTLLKAVIQHWALPFVHEISRSRVHAWLYIAWVFGFENVFKACLNTLVVDSHYDDLHGLLLEADVVGPKIGLPEACSEELAGTSKISNGQASSEGNQS